MSELEYVGFRLVLKRKGGRHALAFVPIAPEERDTDVVWFHRDSAAQNTAAN